MMVELESGDTQSGKCNPDMHKNSLSMNSDISRNILTTTYKSKKSYDSVSNINNKAKIDEALEINSAPSAPIKIKLYKRRFLMLFLFSFCSMMNGIPQFQYTVVADIVACFYGVSLTAINWTSLVFMVVFLPLVLPVMYLMDKKGLRITLLIGASLNLVASWIQCGSFSSDRYAVIMTSQAVYAIGQVFILSLPPFIAGVWFGVGEVGLACAMGVFGNQLGISLGFIISPLEVTNDCTDKVDITYELSIIGYSMAAVNTVLFIVLLFVFQEKPEMFPSIAQATKKTDDADYGQSLKNLFTDIPFVLLLISYGLITGTYFAMSTLMNEMVLTHFAGAEVEAGWMGAIMVFAGMVGSILQGAFLDRTHKFKEVSFFTFIVSFLLLVFYSGLIQLESMWIQFLFFTLLGVTMTGYIPVGFDFGAEITYPQSEAMSASLLNASTQIFSIILTIIASTLLQSYGDFSSNVFFCSAVFLGTIVIACCKCELKRTGASNQGVKSEKNGE